MGPYIATCLGVRKLRPTGFFTYIVGWIIIISIQTIQLNAQCALACKGKVNISLAEFCQASIQPTQILTGGIYCPDARYRMDILDYNMHQIPTSPIITEDYIGMTVIARVYDSTSQNSCWSKVLVEEKNAPIILCRHDTVYCNDSIIHNPPIFYDYCDPHPTIRMIWEDQTNFPCDSHLIKLIVRAWVAQDSRGNISLPCLDSIWIKRIDLDSVKYPKNWVHADNCSIECNSNYLKDSEGHPSPEVTGYPSLGGIQLLPSYNSYCNLSVSYEDVVILKSSCKTKILRLWRVVEWWCGTAVIKVNQQYIEIVDTKGPVIFHCPYDMTVSTTTSYQCQSHFQLPEIEAKDDCQDSVHYEIYSDGNLISSSNGGFVTLELGDHDVEYRAIDACYNYSSCRIVVTVVDKNPPVAVCQQGIVVSMSRSDSIHVSANVFDDGSHDECQLDSFLARRMDNGAPCIFDDNQFKPYVRFCCEDVGKKLMVVFRVKDQSGNVNDCMIEVEVQDKSAPVIVCPHDYSMPCTRHIDTVNLKRFGEPNYYDNCVVHMHEYVDTFLNQCHLGYLQRNFVIEDNMRRRDTCSQKIQVYNPNPFQGNQIIWPRDTIIYSCGKNVDPKNLEEANAYPRFIDVECSLPGHSYKDDAFNYIQDSSLCFKVLRKWTVIDWCNEYYDSVDMQRKFASWTHLQIIKVNNKIPPKIQENCDTITRCVSNNSCIGERIKITHTATDDCTPDNLLRASFKLDLFNNGLIDSIYTTTGNVISWDGDLPFGVHRFIWIFEDQCGNHIVCDQIVRILNCKIPTAYCLTGIAVNLGLVDIKGDGRLQKLVDVWAGDVDHGSYQLCGNPVTLSFSSDSTDKYRRYTCDSLGQRRVELWVTDRYTGLQDRCVSFVTIQDNNKICGGNIVSGTISGLISTPDGRAIPSSSITLEDQSNQIEKTAADNYAFENLNLGKDYKIKVKNDQNYLEGISTLDIVKIQKHILGKEYFSNVWQYLAADVTNDEKITSSDIAALRKLILGVDYKFKNSMSWKYIIGNYQFPDPENPWVEQIPTSYYYPSIPGDMKYTDFKGIKVGDVSESAWATVKKIETRNVGTVHLHAQLNNEKSILIMLDESSLLSGFQFTLKFNPELNQLTHVQASSLSIDESNVSYQFASNGMVLMSWNSNEVFHAQKNEKLFSIEFDQEVTKELLESIEINSDVIHAEAYDDQDQILNLKWSGNNNEQFDHELSIGVPVPNPFYDITTIVLDARKELEYNYQIRDINGQLISDQIGRAQRGKNFIKIKSSSLTHPGIYILRIEAAGLTRSYKLIKMNN